MIPRRREKDTMKEYLRAFGARRQPARHIAIEIAFGHRDGAVALEVRIPADVLAEREPDQPLLWVASRITGVEVAPAITRLTADGAAEEATSRHEDVERATQETTPLHDRDTRSTAVVEFPAVLEAGKSLCVTMLAWGLVEPEGSAPYVRSRLQALLRFPAFPNVAVLVTFVTPEDVRPRSIQGSHVLAYPSARLDEDRLLRVHYEPGGAVDPSLLVAPSEGTTGVWADLARLTGAMGLAATVLELSPPASSPTGQSVAIATALAGLIAVIGTLLRQVSDFDIYQRDGRRFQAPLLVLQLAGLVILVGTLLKLRRPNAHGLLTAVEPAALSLAAVAFSAAALGLLLHAAGFWQNYVCDRTGCERVIRVRRNMRECHHTGRVFCNEHLTSVCQAEHCPFREGASKTEQAWPDSRLPCRHPDPAAAA